ncbi:DUF2945 domain-containing protein [Amycolatopsis rubida]|uniref:Hypervirulence associated protein TUDOR domain-containing protein n=1 Tax=Amycolatopsis rubida TaxID=112413 RepID=A0A1I5KAS9_9PSEU|nr:DUF2945 domain-containing protein [Amycolatopsis rubida]SFO81706.1 Protein of unknown function [Amycolatopsis rubida]
MTKEFRKGDQVKWDAGGESPTGVAERKLTSDTAAGGREVKAAPDDPQYLVRSGKSGKTAVHRPEAIHPA